MQADVAHVGVTDLKDLQVEHHFRAFAVELAEKLGGGFDRHLWAAQRDCARCGVEADEFELEERSQRIQQFVEILRRVVTRNIKRTQAHAIVDAMILGIVDGGEENLVVERDAKTLGDGGGGADGGCEIGVFEFEIYVAGREAVVEDYGESVAGGDCRDQTARIAAIVEIMEAVDRLDGDRAGAVNDLRCFGRVYGGWSKSIADALLGEFILWVEVERGAELGQRFHGLSAE